MRRKTKNVLILLLKIVFFSSFGIGLCYILSYLGLLSYRSAVVTIPNNDTVASFVEEKAWEFVQEGKENPFVGLYYFLYPSTLKKQIISKKEIKDVVMRWKWFNVLEVSIDLHQPFAYICERNRTIYPSECAVYSEEWVPYTSLDNIENKEDIIYIIQEHYDGSSLASHHFEFLFAIQAYAGSIDKAVFSLHKNHSSSFVLTTASGIEIIANPDVASAVAVSALESVDLFLDDSGKTREDIAKIHIYDPRRIALWWRE